MVPDAAVDAGTVHAGLQASTSTGLAVRDLRLWLLNKVLRLCTLVLRGLNDLYGMAVAA